MNDTFFQPRPSTAGIPHAGLERWESSPVLTHLGSMCSAQAKGGQHGLFPTISSFLFFFFNIFIGV